MDAIIYLRQSQDRTGNEYGVSRQRDDARTLARLREWNVVEEFVDNDVSAAGKRIRPGFEAVLRALQDGRARAVIAWDMSRLSRNSRDTFRLMETGQAADAVLAFVRASDLDLTTADGRMVAGILSTIALAEIEKKAERQRAAAIQAAKAGRRIAGRRAFGYGVQVGVDVVTGKPIIDYDQIVPEEAEALRKAFKDRLAGAKLGTIAKELNAKGLLPTQGTRTGGPSRWTAQNLGPVLLNPRYAGLRVHTVEKTRTSMHPVKARLASIVGKAAWPAIVDEPTWRAVVAVMTDPARRVSGRSGQRFLTGVAVCGICKATVHGWKNKLGQPAYRCSGDYGHLGRRIDPVDDYVNEFVVAFLSRPDLREVLRTGEPDDADELWMEMKAVRGRLDEQAALHAAGEIDTAQLRDGSALLRRRLEQVEARMASAGRDVALSALAEAADPGQAWGELDVDRRRAVVQRLFRITLLSPGRGVRAFRPETVLISLIEPSGS